ncbi:AbrB/MazE/SpoVT family DNA-binding domain-containing protein [Facilibium subflavum]|uniref:AbrB/MazE/SpoVT family DNA-binding domain-containing protein n=1 Tax=Facilibium subflavum TaxID=2219058 RepID=UPI000E64C9F6|nr:AbrB/MazE/SpoVT family DNA-binding domain-containing protein [Facilibium subflavum]
MHSVVSKWGNSLGVRIPTKIAQKLQLSAGSDIEIEYHDDALVIKKKPQDELQFLLDQVTPENKHYGHDNCSILGKENIDD